MPESSASDVADPPSALLLHPPLQARSRRTLQRILDAGLDLLETQGPDALTVTGIIKRARTSVGSFYARFQGRDDLLRYLGERTLEDSASVWREAKDALSEAEELRPTVEGIVRALDPLYLEGPAGKLLLLEGIEDPPPSRSRRLSALLARDLGRLLDLDGVQAEVATRVTTGILREAVLARRGGAVEGDQGDEADEASEPLPEIDPEVLLPELVELLVGYLGGSVRRERGESAAARPEPRAAEPAIPAAEPSAPMAEPAAAAPERESPAPAAAPDPPAPKPVPPAPDPFDVWG